MQLKVGGTSCHHLRSASKSGWRFGRWGYPNKTLLLKYVNLATKLAKANKLTMFTETERRNTSASFSHGLQVYLPQTDRTPNILIVKWWATIGTMLFVSVWFLTKVTELFLLASSVFYSSPLCTFSVFFQINTKHGCLLDSAPACYYNYPHRKPYNLSYWMTNYVKGTNTQTWLRRQV